MELSLPVYNNFMIKSQSLLEQKIELLKNTISMNRAVDVVKKVEEDEEEELKFKVEVNMDPKILELIKIDPELTLFKTKAKTDSRNKIKIECNFNIIIKDLALDLVLVSPDRKDVRRFKAHINISSQPIVSSLSLKTHARTPLIQEIPIENPTAKDWKIQCIISEEHGGK